MKEYLKVLSPFDLSLIEEINLMSEEEAFQALDKAYALFNDRSKWLSKHQRIEILQKITDLMTESREGLAKAATKEGGKPIKDSLIEIDRAIEGVKIAIETLKNQAGREVPMGINAASANRFAMTSHEPRGVVLAISAFNHPINLIIHQVIPAIASGCPVLIKPTSSTPLSCRNIIKIIHEAGLPKDWAQMIMVKSSVAEKLVQDPRISFLTFIGSGKVGWHLRSKLPAGATCTLEHGGAAPVIIEADADLSTTIPLLVKGGYYHAGQVCVSVQRIYVHQDIEEKFLDEFIKQVTVLQVGDPLEEITEVGPLISPKEVDRIESWLNKAKESGARILCGGSKISDTCFEPSIIHNPNNELEVSKLEIFGPVTCVYSYSDTDEAIRRANSLPLAFQAAVFTKDLDKAFAISKNLNANAVMVNDHTAFRVDWMPFGGYKESGLGLGGIPESISDMSIEKLTVIKSKAFK